MAGPGGAAASRELLAVGRRGVLDRVQSFLPQMAHANDELKRKMVTAPAHQFDIENLDTATEKVIEMNVAVVELSDSDTDEEILTSEDDSESEDDCITDEVTIDNIKFPKQEGEKGKIEILDSRVNE
ncbi:NOP protein chaperone 1 isoform X2 [Tyto alba]|uniref:NOP protein chaperone 1 isoform X2 n=1 Tax=Tyto alba TaxID=56313 RepID=UPI001C679283|nr:NOP protein chaperone 1 isoform X2 [Tyto alba]